MTRLVRYCLFAILIVLLTNGTSCINDSEPPEPPKQLDIGSKTELGSLEVGPEGGTIEVTTGKYAGIKVVIPVNAYPTKHTVRLYASPITGNTLGENVNPRSDLITFDANGVFAQANITIKVPIEMPANGEFAMGFYYDRETKEFEGLPMASADDKFITLVMRKPSEFLISSIATSKLAGVHASGFVPGKDDWDFINEGTAQTPNGQVAGMTLSALWYYYTQTARGNGPLWGRFNSEHDIPPTMWYDNVQGLHFATQTELMLDWQKNWKTTVAGLNSTRADLTRYSLAYSLLLTNKPQLISMTSKEGVNFPFIVYRADAEHIFISDPNQQAKQDRKVSCTPSSTGAYNESVSTLAAKRGSYFTLVYSVYMGASALVDFELISQKYNSAEDFKSVLPASATFTAIGTSKLLIVSGKIYAFSDSLRITCPDNTAQVFVDGKFKQIGLGTTISLGDGKNVIGVLQTKPGPYAGTSLWQAWEWYEIYHEEQLLIIPIKDTGYIGQEIKFRAVSSQPIESVEWNSGDGRTSILSLADTFKTTYLKTGEYTITVAQRDKVTGKDIATATSKSKIILYPFTILPEKAETVAGFPVLLLVEQRHNSNLHLRYKWDFGDGTSVAQLDSNQAQHHFTTSGLYTITLKAYESSSNSLYGEAESQIEVSVLQTQKVPLELLNSMKKVAIEFTGLNTYILSDRSYQGPLPPVYESLAASAGNSDSVWNNNSFTLGWSSSGATKDTVGGWPNSSSHSEGVQISGEVATDGSKLNTITARRWNNRASSSGGASGGTSSENNGLTLSFRDIYATSVTTDSIVYYAFGPLIANHTSIITDSHRSESQMQGGHFYFTYKNYSSTNWGSLQFQPKLIIKFFK